MARFREAGPRGGSRRRRLIAEPLAYPLGTREQCPCARSSLRPPDLSRGSGRRLIRMAESLDVAVVGAGPYGLSVAAHLRGRRVSTFGEPMETWRTRMPPDM